MWRPYEGLHVHVELRAAPIRLRPAHTLQSRSLYGIYQIASGIHSDSPITKTSASGTEYYVAEINYTEFIGEASDNKQHGKTAELYADAVHNDA